jgi:hypothetical protein
MSGAIPQLPNTPSWRSAQLKQGRSLYTSVAFVFIYCVDKSNIAMLILLPITQHGIRNDVSLHLVKYAYPCILCFVLTYSTMNSFWKKKKWLKALFRFHVKQCLQLTDPRQNKFPQLILFLISNTTFHWSPSRVFRDEICQQKCITYYAFSFDAFIFVLCPKNAQ